MRRLKPPSALVFLTALAFTPAAVRASDIGHEIADQINEASYRYFLDTQLFTRVGDNRGYDSEQHDLARDNIVAIFESYRLEVELHPFDYDGETYYNVVATQPGTVYPDAQYIAGAHYDSVWNPGADDDGSGVAALLEIARILSCYETEYTVKYISFDLEEMGLVGSEAYVADHLTDDIRGMVQMDMIAWNNGGWKCQIRGEEASDPIKDDLAEAFAEYATGVTALVKPPLPPGYRSDHMSFESAGFQACLLIEHAWRFNSNCHGARDSVDLPAYIDYVYAAELARGVAGFLADHAVAQLPYDCDADGVADETQIQNDPSLDCNGNHILDECEYVGDQDLNGNGVLDICDIYAGTSIDCNGNWVPDEVEPGHGEDCNGNGITDFCDLANHVSEDLNRDDIPDECQLHGIIYVDDDAPSDPGPGDPNASDPNEDGSAEHPFDSITQAVALSVSGDEIVVRAGLYTGPANRAIRFGGRRIALRGEGGAEHCVIDLQGLGEGVAIEFGQGMDTRLEGFTIRRGASWGGAALRLGGADPIVANCVFEDNVADFAGGALSSEHASPLIAQCVFRDNAAPRYGGAVELFYGGPILVGCAFHANGVLGHEQAHGGGAIYAFGTSATFVNCIFSDNHTTFPGTAGGAVRLFEDKGTALRLCSFARNQAADAGGAVSWKGLINGHVRGTMANCLLWDNQASAGSQLCIGGHGVLAVSYCNVAAGSEGVLVEDQAVLDWGPGNIDADPLFADPNSGDLHLLPGSPCIDAGGNAFVPPDYADLDRDGDVYELTPLDLDYEGRFFDDPNTPDSGCGPVPIVDMGAYEFGGTGPQPCLGDLNDDRVVNLSDLALLLSGYGVDDRGDLDCDADTDLDDLYTLLDMYGTDCP